MQTSSKPLHQDKEQKIISQFATVVADITDPLESEQFLRDFLTETELSVLSKRLAIFQMLKKKNSYQEIQQTLQVSSATVSSVSEFSRSIGARVVERKLKVEEWASSTTTKILGFLPGFKQNNL